MKRRTFLASLTASAGALIPRRSMALGGERRNTDTVVVISDIRADTSLAGLEAVLNALIAQAVPCLFVIDPAISSDAPLMPDDPRAVLLRRAWIDYPGLIEFAAFVADLEKQRPYFQARLASLALIQLSETLDLAEMIGAGRRNSTIACLGGKERKNLDGLRSAGVRTVFSLPEEGAMPLRNRVSPSNVLNVAGGRHVSFLDPPEQLLDPAEAESHNVLVFSATQFGVPDAQALATAAAQFARAAAERDLRGKGTLTQARDILVRDGISFRRTVALHLCDAPPGESEAGSGVPEFAAMLEKAAVAFSRSVLSKEALDAAALGFWIPENGQPIPVSLPNVPSAASAGTTGPGITLILGRTNTTWRGLDEPGNLRIPLSFEINAPMREGVLVRSLGALADGVILVHPLGVASHAQRLSVLRALTSLDRDGVTDITSLTGLVSTIMPPDPLLPVLQQTEAAAPAFLRRRAQAVEPEANLLMEDARLAWSYFARNTNRNTGLCQAAVSGSGKNESEYDRLTMWDIGSHINALVAAADLGLIDKAEFTSRTGKVLGHLTGRKILGFNLPPEEVIVATGRTTRNFNAFDTGRLLLSLAQLARHPFAGRSGVGVGVGALVASWDLKDVVIDGKYHSITSRKFVPAYSSQYADYSSQGLRAWGIAAKTPYAGFTERGSADQKMTLLGTLESLGPFGAEPVLLQALEHGLDTVSGYLADTLFAAMLSEYETRARLLCPSETPLDRPPWFIYQGLQLGSKEPAWRVVSDQNGEIGGKNLDESNLAISCKGAYLWAAVINHPLSALLLRYVREKARNQIGFASCIYVDSGKATSESSDINTNGIILQSLAAMLAKSNL